MIFIMKKKMHWKWFLQWKFFGNDFYFKNALEMIFTINTLEMIFIMKIYWTMIFIIKMQWKWFLL